MNDRVRTEDQLESAPEALAVRVDEAAPGVAVVRLIGDIDMLTSTKFREGLRPRLEPPAKAVVLDLTAVGFLGSTALSELVAANDTATRNGVQLLLVAASRTVLRPLEITGLRTMFGVYGTVDAALEATGNV